MDSSLKKKLRALSLGLRHTLEGSAGQSGDLENRLNQMGVWRDRAPKPAEELQLSPQGLAARRVVDAFLQYREEAGVSRQDAFAEFVRESAYSWANRLFMLRCLESRGLIDEVVLQKEVYGGRSLVHHRFSQQNPAACAGEDDGLFEVLEAEFRTRAVELPTVFDPKAPAITLRPSVSALKRCVGLLSGTVSLNGQDPASDELFEAGDAPGWAYQFWNAEEKDRVFEKVRTQKGAKIEGADLIPATQLYTEPYMVKFLVQNSLGALWAGMYPETKLTDGWEYYVRDADRTPPVQPDPPPFEPAKPPQASNDPWIRPNPKLCTEADIRAYARTLAAEVPEQESDSFVGLRNQLLDAVERHYLTKLVELNQSICEAWNTEWPARRPKLKKKAAELTFLDPACGSGHFLLEAFDLLYSMYKEEGVLQTPEEICASILNNNLYGIDIDERAVQISIAALWMHALESAPHLRPEAVAGLGDHIIAANLSLPRGRAHLEEFLEKHPDDRELRPALEAVFRGLAYANQLGTLLRVEEPVERELQGRKEEEDRRAETVWRRSQAKLDFMPEQYVLSVAEKHAYEAWKRDLVSRLKAHFSQEATLANPVQAFFGRDGRRSLGLFELLADRYDVVAANPPWMGSNNMSAQSYSYLETHYTSGKRDLYAAFIIRCKELCRTDGYVAMITQQSWLFLRSFAQLRGSPEAKKGSTSGNLLYLTSVECLAHLGRYAFSELGNAVIQPVLFVLRSTGPSTSHRVYSIRLKAPRPAEEQAARLRRACVDSQDSSVYTPGQLQLYGLPESALVYWLPNSYLGLTVSRRRDETELFVSEGIGTRDQARFLRFTWEVRDNNRFFPYSKGGSHCRWFGLENFVVEWFRAGVRVKSFLVRRHPPDKLTLLIQHEYLYGEPCLTYSAVAQGSMNARVNASRLFSGSGPGVFWKGEGSILGVLAILNSRFTSFLLRGLTAGSISFCRAYVEKLPITSETVSMFEKTFGCDDVKELITLKRLLIARQLTEDSFTPFRPSQGRFRSFSDFIKEALLFEFEIAAKILMLEGENERRVFEHFAIPESDVRTTVAETGAPAAWNPIVRGYDGLLLKRTESQDAYSLDAIELSELKQRLASAYSAGPGIKESDQGDIEDPSDDDEDVIAGASIPIPAETFLEQLSNRLQVHPGSLHLLIEELRSEKGVVCRPELARLAEDHITVVILRLLGHQWPKENEGRRAPESLLGAGGDGILSFNDGNVGRSLRRCVLEHLETTFECAAATEFEDLVDVPIARWLERVFVPRHIRQFRGRPIAWHVQSKPSGRAGTPVLSCLCYCHKIAGALPNLRTQYAGVLRVSYESEQRTLEQLSEPTVEQSARQERLASWIDELRHFQETLENIEAYGFSTAELRPYAVGDAIHALARRWLGHLREELRDGPLPDWQEKAEKENLHAELPAWLAEAVEHVDRQCVVVAPEVPVLDKAAENLTSAAFAELFRGGAPSMIRTALEAVCREWQSQFDKVLIQPLRVQIKAAEEEYKSLEDNIENKLRRKDLKSKVKALKAEIAGLAAKSGALASQIQEWRCPDAETWVEWLATQPLYDEFASLDGRRPPPKTVAEFVSQESQYAPDLNDGVRVNIAPLQKAGILARDVLAPKDVEKAIADRAEWRADERRWCRQGILPQPGWWIDSDGVAFHQQPQEKPIPERSM